MLNILDPLRELSLLSIALRMLLAVICGGAVGLEREFKRRPAGFRTHILICLGAAMTTLTSQYLASAMHFQTDLSRLGAQVIAGIGFIGAGTIIVTRRQRVKGLTTAAGLWTAAIVGLAVGAGFYEGALLATALILISEVFFSRIEYRLLRSNPEINLYLEYVDKAALETVLSLFHKKGISILNMEITRSDSGNGLSSSVIFTLRLSKRTAADALLEELKLSEGILLTEEL